MHHDNPTQHPINTDDGALLLTNYTSKLGAGANEATNSNAGSQAEEPVLPPVVSRSQQVPGDSQLKVEEGCGNITLLPPQASLQFLAMIKLKQQWLEHKYYQWCAAYEPEVFMPEQVIYAELLSNRFSQDGLKNDRKCTNIAKFLFNVLFQLIQHIDLGYRYMRWIASIKRRYCQNDKQKSRSRFSLIQLLGDVSEDRLERLDWKALHRGLLCRELTQNRLGLILNNSSIPAFNKVFYMYYCKMYEWRLGDCRLLQHLK